MAAEERVQLTIEITQEQREQINQLARERGYDSASDYLLALVREDSDGDGDMDEDDIDPEESFRRGWHDVLSGNTYPASTLWEDIDDD
jgi:Arc/MetJ-type ribon-helix-helix transcriptional regulator